MSKQPKHTLFVGAWVLANVYAPNNYKPGKITSIEQREDGSKRYVVELLQEERWDWTTQTTYFSRRDLIRISDEQAMIYMMESL